MTQQKEEEAPEGGGTRKKHDAAKRRRGTRRRRDKEEAWRSKKKKRNQKEEGQGRRMTQQKQDCVSRPRVSWGRWRGDLYLQNERIYKTIDSILEGYIFKNPFKLFFLFNPSTVDETRSKKKKRKTEGRTVAIIFTKTGCVIICATIMRIICDCTVTSCFSFCWQGSKDETRNSCGLRILCLPHPWDSCWQDLRRDRFLRFLKTIW